MRRRSSVAGLGAGLMLLATLAGPAMAAGPAADLERGSPPSVHAVTTTRLRLPDAQCSVAIPRLPGGRPAGSEPCSATLTFEITASREPRAAGNVRTAPAKLTTSGSGCSITWTISSLRATVQSILWGFFWSASANATGYGDSCGRVMWTSVTCDQHGIGYAVSIDWCDAYPGRWAWYAYTSTNIGLNITVSAVADGTPIAWTHGARDGFNPYTGTQYGFFAW
jgi:hypothetical protein